MSTCVDYLKSCIEKSFRQQGAEFSEDYGNYGFWSSPFSGFNYPLSTSFDILFIDRKKEIEEISREFVNSFLGKGEDVAVVGAEGMGARSIINLLKQHTYDVETEDDDHINTLIKQRLLEIYDLKARSANEDTLGQLKLKIEMATKQKKTILILSAFDEKVSLVSDQSQSRTQFRKLLELDRFSHDMTVFFSPWNATAFDFMLEEEFSAISIYEKIIFLKPLSEKDTIELIKSRIKVFKHESPPKIELFNDEGIKSIAKFSGGIPKYALKFADVVLEEAIKAKRNTPLAEKYVESVLKQQGYSSYDEIKKRLQQLIPKYPWETKHGKVRTEMKILQNTILMAKPTTSTEIGKLISKSRVAVLENLKKLERAEIIKYVSPGKDSRKRPFILNDFAKAVFEQEFIIPDIENKLQKKKDL